MKPLTFISVIIIALVIVVILLSNRVINEADELDNQD
ncbi:hypothetical protein UFOVP1247_271 [uncultured Caudovirales phage]|jgi:hypothetical protein|uniref:Uncharacterized protein n=1 Tax=uncultured Caudovirales phage TaxID=2100421 RepID=A0A6J5Q2G9_9CAUD|nr:hypothetical protein UFOVP970_311 [uncultured Caudovirales phage]CAB4193900.1 hypothetical protein UFOVP1247_271 [uncultured Caudovirales phage]